jgi:hypothetical protein
LSEEIDYLQRFGCTKVPKKLTRVLHGRYLEQFCSATFENLYKKEEGAVGVIATEDRNASDNLWVYFQAWVTKYTNGSIKVIEAMDMNVDLEHVAKKERWYFFRLVKLDNLT